MSKKSELVSRKDVMREMTEHKAIIEAHLAAYQDLEATLDPAARAQLLKKLQQERLRGHISCDTIGGEAFAWSTNKGYVFTQEYHQHSSRLSIETNAAWATLAAAWTFAEGARRKDKTFLNRFLNDFSGIYGQWKSFYRLYQLPQKYVLDRIEAVIVAIQAAIEGNELLLDSLAVDPEFNKWGEMLEKVGEIPTRGNRPKELRTDILSKLVSELHQGDWIDTAKKLINELERLEGIYDPDWVKADREELQRCIDTNDRGRIREMLKHASKSRKTKTIVAWPGE